MRPTTRSSRTLCPASAEGQGTPEPSDVSTDTPDNKARDASSRPEKGKKPRHRMTNRQLEHLEALYQRSTHPSRQEKDTLANKVGMDPRTVTIWFQNRRQLAKKADENTPRGGGACGYAALSEYRRPLGIVDRPNENIALTPDPERELGLGKVLTTLRAAARKVQPTSNCTCAAAARIPNATAPVLIQIGEPEDDKPRTRKTSGIKRTLEQVCSRAEKRIRLQHAEEEGEGDGDTTEDESERFQCKGAASPTLTSLQRDPLKDISIPTKYSSTLAPDIVLGASLLLTFKYSAF